MTITVQEEIIEGRSSSRSAANGPSSVRVFKVECSAGETEMDILYDTAIPQPWDILSGTGGVGEPVAEYALDITCEPENVENTLFKVTVSYGRPSADQQEPSESADDSIIQVGSSVTSDKTTKDKDGAQIIVALTGQPDQTADVDIQVPEMVITFERKESSSPFTKAKSNVGKVNSGSLGSGAFAARTLLCLGIDGTSSDNGSTWQVSYRFQYRPGTWDATIVYIDPETDRPHDDIDLATTGEGWVVKKIYPEADFSTLNLPF